MQRLTEVTESNPLKIFIEIGINDSLEGYPVDLVIRNYIQLIRLIRMETPQTEIFVQNVLLTTKKISGTEQPVIDSILVINSELQKLSIREDIIYVDLFSAFNAGGVLNPEYDCGDNLHLDGAGYLLWCDLISDYIHEL